MSTSLERATTFSFFDSVAHFFRRYPESAKVLGCVTSCHYVDKTTWVSKQTSITGRSVYANPIRYNWTKSGDIQKLWLETVL